LDSALASGLAVAGAGPVSTPDRTLGDERNSSQLGANLHFALGSFRSLHKPHSLGDTLQFLTPSRTALSIFTGNGFRTAGHLKCFHPVLSEAGLGPQYESQEVSQIPIRVIPIYGSAGRHK
jgi:hypothetical protein